MGVQHFFGVIQKAKQYYQPSISNALIRAESEIQSGERE
jgi:hypothetical protein